MIVVLLWILMAIAAGTVLVGNSYAFDHAGRTGNHAMRPAELLSEPAPKVILAALSLLLRVARMSWQARNHVIEEREKQSCYSAINQAVDSSNEDTSNGSGRVEPRIHGTGQLNEVHTIAGVREVDRTDAQDGGGP